MSVNQIAITMCSLNDTIRQEKEYQDIYLNKLNSSDTTKDVRHYQSRIKESKKTVKELENLIESMRCNELITKHIL